jgi:Ni/Co efflux regulator RcnB
MKQLLSILVASTFALSSAGALAADPPKDAAMAKKTAAAPKKPANITDEAWAKMSDDEKMKAAEAAKMAAAPKKKVKKGGC